MVSVGSSANPSSFPAKQVQRMDQNLIRKLLRYDRHTGHFYWRARQPALFSELNQSVRNWRVWNKKFAGVRAGYVSARGYRYIKLGTKLIKEHRLVWLYCHGRHPAGSVDHIDGDRQNNRISNLRLASNSQNGINSLVARGASGLRGVRWAKYANKWRVGIKINGRSVHLGYFDDKSEAAAAYEAKVTEVHGDFSPFKRPRVEIKPAKLDEQ